MSKKAIFLAPLGALVLGVWVLALISLAGLPLKSLWTKNHHYRTTKVQKVAVVSPVASPAAQVVTSTFRQLNQQFKSTQPVDYNSTIPSPANCSVAAPTLVSSKEYYSASSSINVTIAAFGAGLGAHVFHQIISNTISCNPALAQSVTFSPAKLGINGTLMVTQLSAGPQYDYIWQRGDVVVFARGQSQVGLLSLATSVDSVLNGQLTPLCASENESANAWLRNPIAAGRAYRGYYEAETVSSGSAPEIPKSKDANPTVAIPAPNLDIAAVAVPSPSDYPQVPHLKPSLPAAVAVPVYPTAPTPYPTSMGYKVHQRDGSGPGCGWTFTGMAIPTWDEASAQASQAMAREKALARLKLLQANWGKSIQAYYDNYALYRRESKAYGKYEQVVSSVAATWVSEGAAWTSYDADYSAWQTYLSSRRSLIESQRQAWLIYRQEFRQCAAASKTVTTPTVTTPAPTATTAPTTTPTAAVSSAIDPASEDSGGSGLSSCPPAWPAILSQSVPPWEPAPTKPSSSATAQTTTATQNTTQVSLPNGITYQALIPTTIPVARTYSPLS